MGEYVETTLPNGGTVVEWVSPPPAPTYKKDGLTRTEWIGLFTPAETTLHTKTRALIDNMSADFSYLSGGALMDQAATALGRPDATYRELLRDVFFHFDAATYPPGISVNSPNVIAAMAVQVALGLITQESSNTKLLGKLL